MALVQRFDSGARGLEQRGIFRHVAFGRVNEIAEDGEMNDGIHVRERRHLQSVEQVFDVGNGGEQHRHNHDRPRVRRQIAAELEALEALRQNEQRDQPLNQADRNFAGRHHQQRDMPTQNHGPTVPACRCA